MEQTHNFFNCIFLCLLFVRLQEKMYICKQKM